MKERNHSNKDRKERTNKMRRKKMIQSEQQINSVKCLKEVKMVEEEGKGPLTS